MMFVITHLETLIEIVTFTHKKKLKSNVEVETDDCIGGT